jgi:6-phosphogluconolactonase (cycloisomerase 2 family)
MKMQIRAGLTAVALTLAMGLAGCGHYVCTSGANFGSSTCDSSTGSGGGGLNGTGTVYTYLLFDTDPADGMAADSLSLSANSWQEQESWVPPALPSTPALDGGTVVVNLSGQKYFYVAFHNGTVYGYSIDGSTGALTTVANAVAVIGGTSITANPAGTFLFVSDATSGDITVFSISPTTGALTAVGTPFFSGIAAAQLATDGAGDYLYATAGTGGAQVAAMSIGSTGTLTLVPGSPFGFTMAKVIGENSGKYLLGISGFDDHIHVFDIGSQGVITEATAAGSPFTTAGLPENMVLSPNGNFVYTFDGEETPMEGYSLNVSTGALTAVAGSPFTGLNLEVGQFDQSGLYMFGISEGSTSAEFLPYGADPSTGIIAATATNYTPLGIPEGSFAVSDLTDAP